MFGSRSRLFLGRAAMLGRERAAAAAGLHSVGIVKGEALLLKTVEPVNRGAI